MYVRAADRRTAPRPNGLADRHAQNGADQCVGERNLNGKTYTVQELAAEWGWSESTIRTLFENEPLVLKKVGPKGMRVSRRIPAEVALRVKQRLQQPPTIVKLRKPKKERHKVYLYPEKHKKAVARAEALLATARAAATAA